MSSVTPDLPVAGGNRDGAVSEHASIAPLRKATKDMTKAERRALQEQQREHNAKERAARESGGSDAKRSDKVKAKAKDKDIVAEKRKAAVPAPVKSQSKSLPAFALPQPGDLGSNSSASVMSLFLHLDAPKPTRSLSTKAQSEMVHPCIQRLALQYADFKIVGANARCLAMLEAFKILISTYIVPPGKSLSRHLPTYLSPQIVHLVKARAPLAVSMGNAIRYLKWEISQIPPEMPDDEAREVLCERINHFIRDRILLAGQVIEENAITKINNGDVVMTFARSSLVEGVLLAAKRTGKAFSVVIVDSRPMHEGRKMLKSLLANGISCSYILLPAIGVVLPTVSLTILGTHAMLSNGAMFSRAGTAMVAMMSKGAGIPVICCCETYKFSDRIMLDSIVGNERGSTADILDGDNKDVDNAHLGVLNFLYDVSRPEDVTAVVTETAIIPVQSVPFVLREHKPISLGG